MSSSSFSGGGETLQLSFGPAANAVTSHLCNLQGLASTTPSSSSTAEYDYGNSSNSSRSNQDDTTPLCDPYVTHAVQKDIYVPRVLFVDGRNHFSQWPTRTSSAQAQLDVKAKVPSASSSANTSNNFLVEKYVQKSNWGGNVEVHHRTDCNLNSYFVNSSSISSTSISNNNDIGSTNDNNTPSSFNSNSTYIENGRNASNNTIGMIKQLSTTQQNALHQFQTLASASSSSSNNLIKSRYQSSKYKHVSSQFVYSSTHLAADESGRCMKWDEDEQEQEEEEEEEEEEYYKVRRQQLEQQKWNEHELKMQHDLNHAWDTFFTGQPIVGGGGHGDAYDGNDHKQQKYVTHDHNAADDDDTTSTQHITNNPMKYLQWYDYFMPPHPSFNTYTSPLSFDYVMNPSSSSYKHHQQQQQSNKSTQSILYSHYCGKYPSITSTSSNSIVDGITNEYRNELSDKIRKWMEECDALKGIQIMVDNDKSLFGGLATSVLEELHDECKSAGKFSILVHDGDCFDSSLSSNQMGTIDEDNNTYWRSERKVVDSFRSQLNNGLNLHGIDENSDLVLPLSLKKCWDALGTTAVGNNHDSSSHSSSRGSLFQSAAVGALALETVTLPYRLLRRGSTSSSTSSRSKLGIMSGYYQGSGQSSEHDAFPTSDRLSYHEFLSSLRPSNSHTVLELSTCLKNDNLHNRLLQGTSIERRKLEEERERNRNSMYYRRSRGRDIDPGLWLEDSSVGVMNPLIPINDKLASRSIHRHFALATSYRPTSSSPSTNNNQLSMLTSLTMEGMGIRYRPQCSVSTIMNQSLFDLTSSRSYAAGSYWRSIFNGGGNSTANVPILSVVGNTTRVYSHLNKTSSDMSTSLGRKYQGYLRRDSVAGMVPEEEDCTDSLEHCLKLKDTYEPPMMFDNDEGIYFDDNTD